MPVIVNPFQGGQDPTAQAIANVGSAMFGNTGAAELRKQQILDAQRKNVETGNFGDLVRRLGTAGALADNSGQSMLYLSGSDPSKAADLALAGNANAYGAADPRTDAASRGAGASYDSTAAAFNAKLAENARQFNQKPIDAVNIDTGQPGFATQGNTTGFRPPESDTNFKGRELGLNFGHLSYLPQPEQNVLGAKGAPTVTHNYITPGRVSGLTLDGGQTDSFTHQPLPQGTQITGDKGAQTQWRPATADDLKAAGISGSDPAVYQVSSNNEIRAIPGAMQPGSTAPVVMLTPEGNPDPVQQAAFLKTLDPGMAGMVKGLVDYRLDPTKIASYRGNQREQLIQLATQADPTFDMTQYPARQAMKKSVTSGVFAQNITAANTAIMHAAEIDPQIDALGNGGFTPGNVVRNAVSGVTGNPNITNFNQTKTALVDEVTKMFKGGVSDVKSIEDWKATLEASNSPEQLHAAVQNLLTNLLPARLQTIDSQYRAVMGHPPDFQFLTPGSVAALRGLGIDPAQVAAMSTNDASANAPPAGDQPATAAAPAASGEVPVKIQTDADFAALPAGTLYIDPGDNKQYRK